MLTVKIEVIEKRAEPENTSPAEQTEDKAEEAVSGKSAAQNAVGKLLRTTAKITAAAAPAIMLINNDIDYQLSIISYETGDSDYAAHVQQKTNETIGLIKFGAGVVGAGLAGFAYGGPAGAAIAVASTLTTTAINEYNNQRKHDYVYNFNAQADNFRINYLKGRAGESAVYGGGRER